MRNYGTLPAINVSASASFVLGPNTLGAVTDPASAEIFPSATYENKTQFVLSEQQHASVLSGDGMVLANIRIAYGAADGRRFEYSADAQYSHVTWAFSILKSQTRSI